MESRLIILSGAGLSQESGISTFRDANGLWENHKIEEVCDYYTWEENISLVHDFYNARRVQLGTVEPNDAHRKIAEWQARYGKDRVVNITCNVDNLLEQAGCENVIHLHGELCKIHTNYECDDDEVIDIGTTEYDYAKAVADGKNPKPFVVFFGEGAPNYQNYYNTMANLSVNDTVIIVGSSDQVVDFSHEAMWSSAQGVVVNPEPPLHTFGTSLTLVKEKSSAGLNSLEDYVKERMEK